MSGQLHGSRKHCRTFSSVVYEHHICCASGTCHVALGYTAKECDHFWYTDLIEHQTTCQNFIEEFEIKSLELKADQRVISHVTKMFNTTSRPSETRPLGNCQGSGHNVRASMLLFMESIATFSPVRRIIRWRIHLQPTTWSEQPTTWSEKYNETIANNGDGTTSNQLRVRTVEANENGRET